MNENPNQEPIRSLEIPAEAPSNPYRHPRPGDIAGVSGTPHDRRAKGLDGDMLDSLLRSRMVEGMQLGHEDGYQAAAKAYANIYDEGWRLGRGEGYTQGYSAVMPLAVTTLEKAKELFDEIAAKTGSDEIKALCQRGNQAIIGTFERL
jgi:hypothetical protein